MNRLEKVRAVNRKLKLKYEVPKRDCKKKSAVDVLVNTILSQNTTDKNSDRAFASLKKHYSNYEEVLKATEDELASVIKVSGFHNIKAKRIKSALKRIFKEKGELNLDFLASMSKEKAKEWLINLHGVGPKTAAIVLNFCFGFPTIAVDTHVYRVAKRLGLLNEVGRDKAHEILDALIPPEIIYEFHMRLIAHGRQICKAQNPKCEICVIRSMCDYYLREKKHNPSS